MLSTKGPKGATGKGWLFWCLVGTSSRLVVELALTQNLALFLALELVLD